MFKRLFLGTTNVDFQKLGSRFYKIFIIEFILFITIILSSLFGIFTLNLSVDFTGGTTYQLSTTYTDNDINDVLNNDFPIDLIKEHCGFVKHFFQEFVEDQWMRWMRIKAITDDSSIAPAKNMQKICEHVRSGLL